MWSIVRKTCAFFVTALRVLRFSMGTTLGDLVLALRGQIFDFLRETFTDALAYLEPARSVKIRGGECFLPTATPDCFRHF